MLRKISLFSVTAFLLLIIGTLACNHPATAVTASDWRAGKIIDDAIFTNKNDMSVSQIQAFLNSKVGTSGYSGSTPGKCDTNGKATSELGGGTRAQYGASHGNPAPFTCLKDYYEVPKLEPGPGIPANNYGGKARPIGAKSAATLIWEAAQNYNINPKVLLVKLQTESAGPLTIDDWPFLKQYTYAMGAHCPDSGPGGSANCDESYAGFSIQISESAALLRYYLDNMQQSWWSYKKPYQNNNILWNVTQSGCGGANVYIENKATAALYTYTPYQPNKAALNNLYGTGNSCSAYGNRNFWTTYSDWFGSTTASPFFRINKGSEIYIEGANKTYYHVINKYQLRDFGYGNRFGYIRSESTAYKNSLQFKGELPYTVRFVGAGDNDPVYVMSGGSVYHFRSSLMLGSYGFSLGGEASMDGNKWQDDYPSKGDVESVVKQSDRPEVYLVENSKKYHIGTPAAYSTLGNPVYNTRPSVVMDGFFVGFLNEGAPILSNDVIVNGGSTYGIYSESSLQSISNGIINETKPDTIYTVSSSAISQIPKTGSIIGKLVRDSGNIKYIINRTTKIVAPDSISGTFSQAKDEFLARLQTTPSTDYLLIRINSGRDVYIVYGNKLYRIYSPTDLSKLGYTFSNVVDASNATASLFAQTNVSLVASGGLFRIDGQPTVYLVDGMLKKRAIPTKDIFDQYRFSMSEVAGLSSASASAYTSSQALSYFTKDTSGGIWLLDSGKKFSLQSSVATGSYGLTPSALLTLGDSVLNTIETESKPAKNLVREKGDTKVYLVENGKKRWITSRTAFDSRGYSMSDVIDLSHSFMGRLVLGKNI